ncbi:MAG: deoxyribonuclease V [Chloroflexota bacterium]|nr:deoxyribonuclease V [Chloroflexota bacterium]
MKIRDLHPWDVTPAEARGIQEDLRTRIVVSDDVAADEIRLVAGVDNTYVKEGGETTAYAVVVILTYPSLEVVETVFASRPVTFPYVPGLLSFREAPTVLAAFANVTAVPHLVLFDGQGYAHPRRMGLASHLGLVLDLPSVGCAKSRLVGTFEEPARTFGARSPLVEGGETVGAAVRTRPRRAPLFVSPGHRVSVETAVELALATCRDGGFMPVPTRMAHDAVTERARPHREEVKARAD